jgi:putative PIN family toxin of toxin-antitoxin system
MFLVVDTNVVVSALLFPGSLPSRTLAKGVSLYKLAVSEQVHTEYLEVFARRKFDPYISLENRLFLLEKLLLRSQTFKSTIEIKVCRDPKDDMFLELAVSAKAACIVSGDPHLLELHPFRGIPILNSADFFKNF